MKDKVIDEATYITFTFNSSIATVKC